MNFYQDKPIIPQRVKRAYMCYIWIACAVWFETIVSMLPLDSDARQFIFMLLWIPVVLSILGATLMALTYSVKEWREWPLLVMMAVLVVMAVIFLALDVRGMGSSDINIGWYVAGSAILILLSLTRYITRLRSA
ncbi:hypothetical protein [Aliifodinibius sp. S!AR15-10]|uniref:hypothetical protein n=1 Tax=Aliifodinibius sp. S!AR15-10 TaxID=2950437 RepID=UPI0028709FA3|nr:hypothetical protein [Aliifodinibius sp. S!AR15-10]